jgi:hypothetical protein
MTWWQRLSRRNQMEEHLDSRLRLDRIVLKFSTSPPCQPHRPRHGSAPGVGCVSGPYSLRRLGRQRFYHGNV